MVNEVDLPHAVIRFKRDVSFPRFSMKQESPQKTENKAR
jgi:hypothetical protein